MSLQHLPSCPVTAVSHSTGKLSQAAQFKVVSSFPILTIEIIAKICVLITVVLCACLLFIPSHDVCCSPALSCTERRTKQTLPCAIPLVGLGLFCPTPPSPPRCTCLQTLLWSQKYKGISSSGVKHPGSSHWG